MQIIGENWRKYLRGWTIVNLCMMRLVLVTLMLTFVIHVAVSWTMLWRSGNRWTSAYWDHCQYSKATQLALVNCHWNYLELCIVSREQNCENVNLFLLLQCAITSTKIASLKRGIVYVSPMITPAKECCGARSPALGNVKRHKKTLFLLKSNSGN